MIPAWFLVREPVAEEGAHVESGVGAGSAPELRLGIRQVLGTSGFWTLGLGDALSGLVYAIFGVLSVVFLTMDLGDERTATRVFSTLQFFIAVGTLPLGFLADRLDFRRLFVACYLVPALATLILLVRGGVAAAFVFAVVAGLAAGGRSALFPMALARTFGPSNVGLVWGWINSVFMLGTAAGPLVGSMIIERANGSTRTLYVACIGILLVSSALVALVKQEVGTAGGAGTIGRAGP
ncbi:MAG TPA: MFS transporter [Deltaproteobacteria bacterium]|nr:MFS transporter [Deltaproteobacteria bacterium]